MSPLRSRPLCKAMVHFSSKSAMEAMRHKVRTTFLLFSSIALFTILYLHLHLFPYSALHSSAIATAAAAAHASAASLLHIPLVTVDSDPHNRAIVEPESNLTRRVSSIVRRQLDRPLHRTHTAASADVPATVSVLLPDWEVLVVAPPESHPRSDLYCLFQRNVTSPARFAGVLPFTKRKTFRCDLPAMARRRLPFYQPILTRSPPQARKFRPRTELFLWKYLTYESLSTEDDVVLFAKGLNNRQGINRSPRELKCVFFVGDDPAVNAVKTRVTSSIQEVFRCPHPVLPPSMAVKGVRVSLEVSREKRIVPSMAYYTPRRFSLAPGLPRSLTCATSMVFNVAKFLKEWVVYHSSIGVERFVLYDNGSDDNLTAVVESLNGDGYDVRTIYWPWAKTQEAGFSHSAVLSNHSCTWMMYVDVDEFVYVPSWRDHFSPGSGRLIKSSLLPSASSHGTGQVSIRCYEFGPSNRKSHPSEGVVQGYTCRRRTEERHKSIVLLKAIDFSLLNVIHHFTLRKGYKTRHLGLESAVVNHYKYQAWPEFKNKFRRRVSAYVADWTQAINPTSKDRTPGLGFEPVEPRGWSRKFCEVTDNRLKLLTTQWFGLNTTHGYKMAWQR